MGLYTTQPKYLHNKLRKNFSMSHPPFNIGPVYIRGWAGGAQGWGGWWQKLNQRRNKTQRVEFRVAMTCTCTHKGPIFHYKA